MVRQDVTMTSSVLNRVQDREDRKPRGSLAGPPSRGFSIMARQCEAFGVADRERKKFMIKRTAAAEPLSVCNAQMAETILAKLVARAFALDHPELFVPHLARAIGGPADDK